MNRETSIHSSDTLVVVDRARSRRRMVIIGAIAVLALFVIGLGFLAHDGLAVLAGLVACALALLWTAALLLFGAGAIEWLLSLVR